MKFPEFDELRKDADGRYHIATDEFDKTRKVNETNAQYKKRIDEINWKLFNERANASEKKQYDKEDYNAAISMIPKSTDNAVAGTDVMTRAKNALTNANFTSTSILSNQALAPLTVGLNAAQSVANTYTKLANKEDIDLKTAIPQKISESLSKEDNVLSNEEAFTKASNATKEFDDKRNELLDNYNSKARRDPNVARNTIDEYLSTYGGTKEDFYLDAQYRKTVTDRLATEEAIKATTDKINNGSAKEVAGTNLWQGLKSYASRYTGLLEAVNKKAGGYADESMPINTYASGVREKRIDAAVQEATKNKIQDAAGDNKYAKDAAGMGYDIVSNLYTNGINRVVSKVISVATGSEAAGEAVGLSTFFGDAFTQALIDGQDKGLTENEQIALGTAQGIVEVGTEKIPFEIGQKYLWGEVGKKEFIKYFGREMRSEFWGEASASVLDTMADIFVAKDKSDAIRMYNALIEDGESKEQAAFDVFISAATDAVYEGTIGFLTAAAGGGAYIVNSNIFSTAAGKALSNDKAALNNLYENGFSNNESDYTSAAEFENAKKAKSEVLKAINDKTGNKKQTLKESRTLYKDVQNAIYDQAEVRNNNRIKNTINKINEATNAQELATATNGSYQTKEIKDAYNLKKASLMANGVAESEITAAQNVIDEALSGNLDRNQIESLPDNLKEQAKKATQEKLQMQAANTTKAEVKRVEIDGKYTDITGNVVDKNGERYLELKDGSLVKADDVTFNKNGELFMRGKLGFREGALDVEDAALSSLMIKTMLSSKNKVNSASIILALNTAYHLGATGVDYQSFKKGYSFYFDLISEKTLKEAFYMADRSENVDKKSEATAAKKGDALHTFNSQEAENEYNQLSDLEKNVLDSFASSLGITFDFVYKKDSNKRGSYNPSTGSIELNLKYSNKLFEIALHEGVGEFLQAHNKSGYDKISDSILNYYASTQSNKLSNAINRYLNAYKSGGESEKTHRGAANELVNDALSDIFSHEGALAEITRWIYENESQAKAKTFANTLVDYLNAIREAIKTVVEMRKLDSTRLKMTDKEAEKLAKEITTALDEAIKNRDAAVGNIGEETSRNSYDNERYVRNYKNEDYRFTENSGLIADFDKITKPRNMTIQTYFKAKSLIKKQIDEAFETLDNVIYINGVLVDGYYFIYENYDDIDPLLITIVNTKEGVDYGKRIRNAVNEYKSRIRTPAGDIDSLIGLIENRLREEGNGTTLNSIENHRRAGNNYISGGNNKNIQGKSTSTNGNYRNVNNNRNSIAVDNKGYITFDNENLTNEEAINNFRIVEALEGKPYLYITKPKLVSNDTWKAISKIIGFSDYKSLKEIALRYADSEYGYSFGQKFTDKIISYFSNEDIETNQNFTNEHAKAAEDYFGTTSNFKLAGYIDINGKLLDFSDGQGYRVQDHREISEVLDLPEDAGYSDGLIQFMSEGNIRINEYGIDISVAPNEAQRKMLRSFFNKLDGEVTVDFSELNGDVAGSVDYTEGTAASRILNDIDSFFETGEVPEGTYNGLNEFRYSIDTEGNTLTAEQLKYFENSKMRDENGNLRVFYHGTNSDKFNVFEWDKTQFLDGGYFGRGFYFAFSEGEARYYGKNMFKVYLNITNPFDFHEKLYKSDPEYKFDRWDNNAHSFSFLTHFAELFPELANRFEIDTYGEPDENYEYERIPKKFSDLKTDFDDYKNNTKFEVATFDGSYDNRADYYRIKHTDKNGYERYDYTEYDTKEAAETAIDSVILNAFLDEVYHVNDLKSGAYYIESIGSDFTEAVKKLGYDGIVQTMNGDEAVAFESNQIKEIDNKNPTESKDIRFSLDTEGNELSEDQQKFFADESEEMLKDGKLEVMYHGSPSGGFYEFDEENNSEGVTGFFFTNNQAVAKEYSSSNSVFSPSIFKSIESVNKAIKDIYSVYSVKEVDGEYGLFFKDEKEPEEVEETLTDIFDKFLEYYSDGGMNYKVYLHVNNPLVIDAKGNDFKHLPGLNNDEYSSTNDYAKYAKDNNFDAVIFNNLLDIGLYSESNEKLLSKVVAVFNPNQVKSVNNTNPTKNADIRLSIDTEGNELSKAQQKFFKDSKAVDEDGKLLVLYHGTLDGNFDIFNTSDNDMIFMSNSRMVASKYTNAEYSFNVKDRTTTEHTGMFKMYANLKNPLIIDASKKVSGKYNIDISYSANTEKYSVVLTNGNETINKVIYGDEKLKETFGSVANQIINHYNNISYNKGLYSTYKYSLKNKNVEFSESSTWDAIPYKNRTTSTDMIAKRAKAEGYDGVIIKNVIDDLSFSENGIVATDVIAFKSNQVKLVDNTNPTENLDIRNSIDVARNSFKEWGEASRYTTQLNETKVISTMLGTMNEAMTDVKLDLDQIQAIEDEIVEKYKVDVERGNLGYRIMYAFNFMNKNKLNVDYETMMDYLLNIGDEVVANSNRIDPHDVEVFDEMKAALSKYTFKLTNNELKEIESAFGGASEWKKIFKTLNSYGIRLDNTKGQTLDSMYSQVRDDVLKITGIALDEGLVAEDQILSIINLMENDIAPKPYVWDGATDLDKSLTVVADIINAYYEMAVKQLENDIVKGTDKGKEAVAKAVKAQKAKLKTQVDSYKKAQSDAFYEKVKEINTKLQHQNEVVKQQNARIKEYSKSLEKLQNAPAEKVYVLDQKQIERTARARAAEKIESYKATQERAAKIDNIKKTGARLIKWLDHPTDKQHIPTFMQEPLGEFLSGIDFLPKNARSDSKNTLTWQQRMETLREVLKKIREDERDGKDTAEAYFAQGMQAEQLLIWMDEFLGVQVFDEYTQSYIPGVNKAKKVSELSVNDLTILNNIMNALSATINNLNKTYANARFGEIQELAIAAGDNMRHIRKRVYGTEAMNNFYNLLNIDELEPITYFEVLGDASKTIFDELQQGFISRTRRIKETSEYMDKVKKELKLSDKKISKWEKQIHTFKTAEGDITLNVNQIMSLYELSKRKQAMPHIAIGGIKVADKKVKKNNLSVVDHQVRPVHISGSQLLEIIDTLTLEQKKFADKMQQYMSNDCAKWGNAVTEKMFGYKKFLEKDYFPIKTDSNSRATKDVKENTVQLDAIKNQSLTKPTVANANNAVVISDIFDVFTEHVVGMANYEGYVMPLSDAMKFYNYNETVMGANEEGAIRTDQNNIKQLIEDVMGVKGQKYFMQFMLDINGDTAGKNSMPDIYSKYLGNFKASAVMANLRVVVQQPTAIIRAMERIEGKYLLAAQMSLPQIRKYANKAQENSMLAYWKAQGYYETLLGQSLKSIITGDQTYKDKINEVFGKPAGIADDLTWGMMYRAAELKVLATTNLKEGTKEFDAKTVEIFEDVINHTQVIDTIFNKSQYMRNEGAGYKLTSTFMTEPTKTYNMLYRAYFDVKQNPSKQNLLKASKIAYIFLLEQAVNSAVKAVVDALRDDEKDEMNIALWYEKFIDNLKGDINILGLVPFAKEIVAKLEGYDSSNLLLQPIEKGVDAVLEIIKMAKGETKKTPYGVAYSVAEGLSMLKGIPVAAALREVKTIYNLVNDLWDGKDLVKTQEAEKNKEKKSYTKVIDKAMETGDKAAIKDAMNSYYEYKLEYYLETKEEKDAKSEAKEQAARYITDTYKDELIELYNTDIAAANELKLKMLDAYQALGYDRAAKNKVINKWFN